MISDNPQTHIAQFEPALEYCLTVIKNHRAETMFTPHWVHKEQPTTHRIPTHLVYDILRIKVASDNGDSISLDDYKFIHDCYGYPRDFIQRHTYMQGKWWPLRARKVKHHKLSRKKTHKIVHLA